MEELRLIGVSEDGESLLLAGETNTRFRLALTDDVKHAARRDHHVSIAGNAAAQPQSPLRPRDVQGLIRAGVPLAEIAERAGWSVEKVERYEGPIRAERDYVAGLAQAVVLPSRSETVTLKERVDRRLADRGVDAERVQWDSWKTDDTYWHVVVRFPAGGRLREATWQFDPVSRALRTIDDEARWLGGEEIAEASAETVAAARGAKRAAKATKPAARPRASREANVYDVVAEGGLDEAAEAQAPHLGAAMSASDSDGTAELTASMKARQARRARAGRGRASTSPTAVPQPSAAEANTMPRVEEVKTDGPPPPSGSHPRPEHTRQAEHDEPNPTSTELEVAADTEVEPDPTEKAPRGRRRSSRRARSAQASTRKRTPLLADDEDEDDGGLFDDLPGFHEGGSDDEHYDAEAEADYVDSLEYEGHDVEEDIELDDGQVVMENDDDVANDADGSEDDGESSDDDVEDLDEKSSNDSSKARSQKASGGKRAEVPERASQTRKGRPSVPSWDDIMFGKR